MTRSADALTGRYVDVSRALEAVARRGYLSGAIYTQTTDVENYPGYPQGVMGPQMMQELRDQAERFGARLETDDVTRLILDTHDPAAFTPIAHLTVGQFREWLLDTTTTPPAAPSGFTATARSDSQVALQ